MTHRSNDPTLLLSFLASLLALSTGLTPVATAQSETPAAADSGTTAGSVDFDDVSAPGPFKFIVPGFDNGPLLVYPDVRLDGGVILSDVLFGNSATTAPNIYATCDTCTLGDGSGLPGVISGTFTELADAVSLDVFNGVASPGLFTLTAFDLTGAVVDSDTVGVAPFGSPGFVQPLAVSGPGIRSFEVTTALSFYTFAVDSVAFSVPRSPWSDLGAALAGTSGSPTLGGEGAMAAGSPLRLSLQNALASSTAWLVVGTQTLNAPFKGGVLVPDVNLAGFPIPLPVGASGRLVITGGWPAGVPSGFALYVQYWIQDPAGPVGFSASNAVSGTAP